MRHAYARLAFQPQVAGSWAKESRAVLEASSQPEMSLNCFKEDVDPSNTRIHVAHPPPSSQTESGGDSALSLLTSSSLSQGKGSILQMRFCVPTVFVCGGVVVIHGCVQRKATLQDKTC